ncbi:MAG: hypothetical protein O2955_20375 [Planctomycetota bacterium]|nr:hypothetical protein [Planctomycetota bacterium]MDA1214865.1 hypothetical protein [Planctomycetota bacterium]
MSSYKTIGGFAAFWLIVIRMSIGWHLMYEGLWKVRTMSTADPWTSAGYLRNSQGPLREEFRKATGDPDETSWLDFDTMVSRWDDWIARFKARHPDLSEDQLKKLDLLVNGPKDFKVKLNRLPDEVSIPKGLAGVIRFDAENKQLIVSGELHMTPRERDTLLRLVDDDPNDDKPPENEAAREFDAAVRRLYQLSSRLSYKDQLTAALKRSTLPDDPSSFDTRIENLASSFGSIQLYRQEAFELYPEKIKSYETALANAEQDFQFDHLEKIGTELQKLRSKLVGPVKSLTKEMQRAAEQLLTPEQLARGPVPEQWTPLRIVDESTMWGLVILGGLLIAGLFSRLSAFAAAFLLTMFYLAMPPFPGVPLPPSPQHALIVNQHMIEILVLLFLAMLPTGKWFGMDAFFGRSN